MNFLYPAFLFGLISLAIPIVVHLFNLKRPKEVLFTNVSFLKNVQKATSSKLKLKHYLVLFSRILFLIFLVLAFAQPIIQGSNPDMMKGSNNVAVYLDNSLSMENEIGTEKAFDAGLKSVSKLNELFNPSTNYLFLTNDFESKDLYVKNKDKFSERLSEVNYSPVTRSGSQILARQHSLLSDSPKSNYLFWFSDFQKSTIGDLSALSIDTSANYYFVPLQNNEVSNVYIDSVWLEEPLVKVNQATILKAKVKNRGNKEVKSLDLKLLLDDVQVSNSSVDVAAGASATTEFTFSVNDTISKKGVVRLEDQPIRFDDDYYFILDGSSKVTIYHIYEGKSSNVNAVYQNEDIFDIESVRAGQIDYSKVENADVVVLENIDNLSSALTDALMDYTRKSGSVVVFPGEDVNVSGYSKILQGVNLSSVSPDSSDKSAYYIDKPDYNNPFFKGVFDKENTNINMPFAYPTIKASASGVDIFRFKNNKTFLSKYNTIGDGSVYLFTAPLTSDNTNFHRHALYVPVMYQLAFSSHKNQQRLAFSFKESVIPIQINNIDKGAVFSLESEGTKVIPSQRVLGNTLYLELPYNKLDPGFYSLKKDDVIIKSLAFNLGPEESQMAFYSPEEIKAAFLGKANVQVFDVNSEEEFLTSFKNENIGIPLWKYCLILSLIFLLTEILFIRFL